MSNMNRRKFNKLFSIAVATPFATLTASKVAHSQEAKLLDPESAAATGLSFKLESDTPDKICEKCSFYSSVDDTETGKCIIFQGAIVPANGICNAFQPKP